jgi:hypothetical protein
MMLVDFSRLDFKIMQPAGLKPESRQRVTPAWCPMGPAGGKRDQSRLDATAIQVIGRSPKRALQEQPMEVAGSSQRNPQLRTGAKVVGENIACTAPCSEGFHFRDLRMIQQGQKPRSAANSFHEGL